MTQSITKIKASEIAIPVNNTRKNYYVDDLNDLKDSIITHGILQPVLIRSGRKDKYEVVAGSRRVFAAKLIDAHYEVPCIDMSNISDVQAQEIRIVENLQRVDIDPLDEALAFSDLIKVGLKIDEIAIKVGKSPSFVATRIKLTNLIEPFKAYLKANDLPIGHALEVAKYEAEFQQRIFNDLNSWNGVKIPDLSRLKEIIQDRLCYLDKARFDIHDDSLVEGAPACTSCPKNTACHNLLFKEFSQEGRCMDRDCWSSKEKAFIEKKIQTTLQEDPNIPVVNLGYQSDDGRIKSLKKDGYNVIKRNEIEVLDIPTEPDPRLTKEQFYEEEKHWIEADELDEKYKEYLEEYEEELDKYNKYLQEYQESLKNPNLIKVLVAQHNCSDEVASIVYALPKSISGLGDVSFDDQIRAKLSKAVSTLSDVRSKISRNDEIAFEKTYDEVMKLDVPHNHILSDQPLTALEKMSLFVMAFKASSGRYGTYLRNLDFFDSNRFGNEKFYLLNLIEEMDTKQQNQFLRACIYDGLSGYSIGINTNTDNWTFAKSLYNLYKEVKPVEVDKIETTIKETYDRKKVNLIARKAELESEIEQIKQELGVDEEE